MSRYKSQRSVYKQDKSLSLTLWMEKRDRVIEYLNTHTKEEALSSFHLTIEQLQKMINSFQVSNYYRLGFKAKRSVHR